MTDQKPCNIFGPHPELGLKNCRTCGLEWHKSERKPNCPYIETNSQKIERLEAEAIEKDAKIERLRAESLKALPHVHSLPAIGETIDEMRANIDRKSKAYAQGDMVLRWVNEGAIFMHDYTARTALKQGEM